MIPLFSLLKIKLIFKKPQKKDILIYDAYSERFAKRLFSKESYGIISVRFDVTSPPNFKNINIYVLILALLKFKLRNFRDVYKKTFFELVSPKIIYTSIDNNPGFYKLKNIYNKAVYIADQNGIRDNKFYMECKKYNLNSKKKLSADYIFLFGNDEKLRIKKIINSKIVCLGNTLNNSYPTKSKTVKKIKSIMFVSGLYVNKTPSYSTHYEKILFNNLIKFCTKNNIKLSFFSRPGGVIPGAFRTPMTEDQETQFYTNHFAKGNWKFIYNRDSVKTNYQIINKQQMIVYMNSTLGLEALSKGIKCVSICPKFPFHDHYFKYPEFGPFWSNRNDYYNLEKILKRIINISNKRWKNIAKKYSERILSYDPNNLRKKKLLRNILTK